MYSCNISGDPYSWGTLHYHHHHHHHQQQQHIRAKRTSSHSEVESDSFFVTRRIMSLEDWSNMRLNELGEGTFELLKWKICQTNDDEVMLNVLRCQLTY